MAACAPTGTPKHTAAPAHRYRSQGGAGMRVATAGRATGRSPGGPCVLQGRGDVLGHALLHQRHADPSPALQGTAPWGSPEDGCHPRLLIGCHPRVSPHHTPAYPRGSGHQPVGGPHPGAAFGPIVPPVGTHSSCFSPVTPWGPMGGDGVAGGQGRGNGGREGMGTGMGRGWDGMGMG